MFDVKHEEFVKDIQDASKAFDIAVDKYYNLKPTDKDINLYGKIIEAIKNINKDKVEAFEKLIKSVEPNIEDKIDIVQKFIISNVMISHLYRVKAKNPKIFVTNIIMLIPYYLDNNVWLDIFTKEALPLILNNNLI